MPDPAIATTGSDQAIAPIDLHAASPGQGYSATFYDPKALAAEQKDIQSRTEGIASDAERNLRGIQGQRQQILNQPDLTPRIPRLQNMPAAPKPEYADPMKAFQSPAIFLAAIASLFTRRPLITAMDSATKMMQGYHNGDKDTIELQRENWKNATEAAVAQNKKEIEQYQLVLDNSKLTMEQKKAQMQGLAAQAGDEVTLAALKSAPLETLYKMNRDKQLANDKLQDVLIRYGDGFGMSSGAIDQVAQDVLAGNPRALTGIGRGIQGKRDLDKVYDRVDEIAKERGLTHEQTAKMKLDAQTQFTGQQAYQRTAGSTSARVENATNEVEQLLPQAIETSRALPRGKFVPWNELVQRWQQGTSDPAYNDFVLANFSLINAYTRAMNPQGVPRVAERFEQKAHGILSTATSPQAYEIQANRLWKEVQASNRAVAQTRGGLGDPNRPSPIPPKGDKQRPRAVNDQGDTVEWDGTAWVRVQ